MMKMDELRSLFPITREKIYLFNGNIIPCATPVRRAMETHLEQWTRAGDACFRHCMETYQQAKQLFAELINASPESVIGLHSTTSGINLAALMIHPTAGQNVVVTDLEHICNVHPWLKFKDEGVEVRYVPARGGTIEMEDFARAVDDETAAVSICHVTMNTGFRWGLAEACGIAHQHGARIVVDAAQSVGAVPTDVRRWRVDFLAAPTYKWLLGPMGAAFLYINPELVSAYDPPMAGWLGVQDPFEIDLRDTRWLRTPQRFEPGGMPGMICFAGAAAGLGLLGDIGHDTVFKRIEESVTYLYQGLSDINVTLDTPRRPQQRAGILAMKVREQDRLWRQLEQKGIHIGNWAGYLRIDPGCYNTTEELDAFLACVGEFTAAS